jgi:hypothetical protein
VGSGRARRRGEPFHHLLAIAIHDQQQDVDPITDDAGARPGHHGRRGDGVAEQVIDRSVERVLELQAIPGARDRDRRRDLDYVPGGRRRGHRHGKTDEHSQ